MRTEVSVPDSGSRTRQAPAPPPGGVGAEVFRRALAHCAAGVVVVTTGARPAGFTASSFTSVSMSPPLVSFCVDKYAGCWGRLRTAETFTVNVLTDTQQALAARFAARGVDRFAPPTRWRHGPDGAVLLDAAAAHLQCRRHAVLPLGDHFLVVGLLVAVHAGTSAPPLLYHGGRYGRFTTLESAVPPVPEADERRSR
ncbi:hypothetical protein GCM10020358_40620 [Amorphoplanes nipponensis]|uniref:Flavin reductase like domain-containing protein n=1 Tax=Actinoplanes nipponensis TaxID=135950 RepID=A0A919JE85_9ACTN|nr:flavin reductase family protein [Actinoplanes nipponensis]GIE47367.1 hypothetical protein Ani05nite_09010 [Actinoplanes nipponensis]